MPSSTPLTMPDERTRALLQKGAFLKEVAQEVRLPEEVRREAYRLLRHCPTASQVRTMALIYQHAALERYLRSEEHTSELQSLMRISYAVFCLKKKTKKQQSYTDKNQTKKSIT